MSNSETNPATLNDLQAAMPGASSEFLVSQLNADVTVDQAVRAHNAELTQKNAALEKRLAEVSNSTSSPGNDPMNDAGHHESDGVGDAASQYSELFDEMVSEGSTRFEAASKMNKENPEVVEAMVAEANAGRTS